MSEMPKTIIKHVVIVMSLTLIFGILSTAHGQTIRAGVSPGDSFVYSFNVYWSSTRPEDTIPHELIELNKTEAIQVTVNEVAGSVVMLNVTKRLKNGTQIGPSQVFIHLLTGMGDGFGLIIPPNLGPKSLVYPLGLNYSTYFIIGNEIVKQYPFGERKVLETVINRTDDPNYMLVRHIFYHDKETGVMLEWTVEQIPQANPQQKIRVVWEITSFNVKSATQSSTEMLTNETGTLFYIIIALGAIAIVITAVAISHRRIKEKQRAK
ncbi:MAG: hypothetical protein QXX41_08025 [Nitrososphaerota archaeon]